MNSIMQPQNGKMRNSLHSVTCEIVTEEKEIPRRPNEIAIKWIDSKDAGKAKCA